jgi:hypothetical protein
MVSTCTDLKTESAFCRSIKSSWISGPFRDPLFDRMNSSLEIRLSLMSSVFCDMWFLPLYVEFKVDKLSFNRYSFLLHINLGVPEEILLFSQLGSLSRMLR